MHINHIKYILIFSYNIKNFLKSVSTGNLSRHLVDVHDIRENENSKRAQATLYNFLSPTPCKLSKKNETQSNKKWILARNIVLWIAKDLLPFHTINKVGLQDFLYKYKVISSNEDLPDPTTLSRTALLDVYESMLLIVKNEINNGTRFCTLTFDLWTDNFRRRNYITFTYHHITKHFALESFTLTTKAVTGRHTGEAIANEINLLIEKFNLKHKDIYVVTDCGSNVKKAITMTRLNNHFCLGHALHNLVSVDGIEYVSEIELLVRRVKRIVRALRFKSVELEDEADEIQKKIMYDIDVYAEALQLDFESEDADGFTEVDYVPLAVLMNVEDIRENSSYSESVTQKSLKTSTPTRWHSVLLMLESVKYKKKAIDNMLSKINKHAIKLTNDDWELLHVLIDFLKQFRQAVDLFSTQKYVSINSCAVIRSELRYILEKQTENENIHIGRMKANMLTKFEHRFPMTELIVTAGLLDPRFHNLTDIETYILRMNLTKETFLISQIKKYIKEIDINQDNSLERAQTDESDYFVKLAHKHSVAFNSEFDIQAECRILLSTCSKSVNNGDILQFWKDREKQLPWLAALARKILCIPPTSTPSERVFSIAGMVLSAKRSRLNPINVDKLIFIHDNYYKYKSESV